MEDNKFLNNIITYMRLDYLDVMKAMAIIAVVLYHTGYMTYGYLGVDVFLVINGYLLAKGFSSLNSIGGV